MISCAMETASVFFIGTALSNLFLGFLSEGEDMYCKGTPNGVFMVVSIFINNLDKSAFC